METNATTALSHKEMTAHIRTRIKKSGIAARVRLYTACGFQWIQVFAVEYGKAFTDDQQRTIRNIAKLNGLTWVRGMEIDIEQMTNPDTFNFVYSA